MADPQDGGIVFVEVKTRANEGFAPAESSITAGKQEKITLAAKYFLLQHKIADRPLRFDVVGIVLGEKGKPQIRHYGRAFVP